MNQVVSWCSRNYKDERFTNHDAKPRLDVQEEEFHLQPSSWNWSPPKGQFIVTEGVTVVQRFHSVTTVKTEQNIGYYVVAQAQPRESKSNSGNM